MNTEGCIKICIHPLDVLEQVLLKIIPTAPGTAGAK